MSGVLAVSPLIAAGKLVRVSLHQHPAAFNQQRPAPAFQRNLSARSRITRANAPRLQPVECTRTSSQLSRTSECDNSEARASAAISPPPFAAQPALSSPSLPISLLSLLPLLPLILADRVLAEPVPLFENGADVLTAAGSGEPVTNSVISLLFGIAVVGLVVLTGGVGYLAYTDWQDKREMEKLAAAEPVDPVCVALLSPHPCYLLPFLPSALPSSQLEQVGYLAYTDWQDKREIEKLAAAEPVKRPTATSEIRAAMKSPPRATPKGFGKKSEKEIAEESDA
ncbi:unnamed protein product [Closterium sp. NIES-54]